jgi:hypothetical protein
MINAVEYPTVAAYLELISTPKKLAIISSNNFDPFQIDAENVNVGDIESEIDEDFKSGSSTDNDIDEEYDSQIDEKTSVSINSQDSDRSKDEESDDGVDPVLNDVDVEISAEALNDSDSIEMDDDEEIRLDIDNGKKIKKMRVFEKQFEVFLESKESVRQLNGYGNLVTLVSSEDESGDEVDELE